MCALQQKRISKEVLLDLLKDDESAQLFLDTLSPEVHDWLRKRLLASSDPPCGNLDFANQIGIERLDPEKQKIIETTALFNYFKHRRELLANSLTAQNVAEMLGVSKQTVHERIKDGKLVGILENGVMKLPTFQFDPEGPNGVVAGLAEILAQMHCGVLGRINWFTTPRAVFEGKAPIEVLRRGDKKRVLQEAQAVGVA